MFKTLSLAFVLALVIVMTLPGASPAVRAINQNSPTRFSPFGPFTPQLLTHFYSDFDVMFSHLQAGDIDISDWQLESQNQINTFCSNPEFFCTTPQEELGIFQEEVNSHPLFMGIPLNQPRNTTQPSFTPSSSVPACSTGFGSLSITLRNQETGSTVLDPLNTLIVSNLPSGSPSTTVSDSGGATPVGVYKISCILAGTYSLRSSVYNATGTTAVVTSATAITGTLSVNWNSQSNSKPTQARKLLGAAMAHLVDDPVFVKTTMTGVGEAPCAFAVLSQGITCPSQAQLDFAECQFGNHPWLAVCGGTSGLAHDASPYNILTDNIGTGTEWWTSGLSVPNLAQGYSGHDDLRAACDDLVSMGLVLSPSTATCNDVADAAAGTVDPGNYPHIIPNGEIRDIIRVNFGRQQLGIIIAQTLDFLFGTPLNRSAQPGFTGAVCFNWSQSPPFTCSLFVPKFYTFAQTPCFGFFFETPPSPDCWHLYTSGQGLDPTPDQLFINRNSINTGGTCAGVGPVIHPNNYVSWCDPQTDTDTSAGELAPTLGLSNQFFQRELINELNKAVQVPGFVFIDTFAENNGWNFQQCPSSPSACVNTQSSIVNTLGVGTQAGGSYFTLLNARQVPTYNPCAVAGAPSNCASFAPGGGNPNIIRRGFSQDTTNLSPFTFNSVWEFDFLTEIYDTMLQTNPNTAGTNAQYIDWGTTSHSSRFNPTEVGCNSINGCVTGVTTQVWHLRNDWKFSDGNDVKATDVAYTLIANRDVPSSGLQTFVLGVTSAVGLDCGPGQPCKTLQVKLQGQSALFEFNIGATQLVIEKALWAPFCGDPPVAGGVCASPAFDPMYPNANSPGIEVGPGPWSCISPIAGAGVPAGHVGGPCARDSTGKLTGSSITTDGTILLSENANFLRCCPNGPAATSSSLYKLSYADHNNDGVVNILDLADVASHFGTADPYWANQNISPANPLSSGVVDAVDLATVAIYFGHGITYPFTPQTLTNVDPQIDPFFCPNTGC